MNNQNQFCEPKDGAASSLRYNVALPASSPRLTALAKPRPAWKSIARFLSQAAVGGALGGYALAIGSAIYYDQNNYHLQVLITLPFILAGGAVLGLLTGALTLVVENLIEEKLSALPRVIVTGAIAVLIIFGIAAFWNSANWQLLKILVVPGAVLGLPVGLVAGSKLRPWRLLLLGVDKPPGAEADAVSGATSLSYGFALIGGFALRLVSAMGVLMAVMVLACSWKLQQTDELLVTIFSIYYFGCTAYVSCKVRLRWVIGAFGTFLNALLLALALLWDPY